MLTYEHSPIVSPVPVVTHSLAATSRLSPSWSASPAEMLATRGSTGPPTTFELAEDKQSIMISGNAPGETPLFVSRLIPITPGTDHALQVPIDLTEGRIAVQVRKADGRTLLASAAVPDALQGFPPDKPPTNIVRIPFVSDGERQMQVVIMSAGDDRITTRVGTMELFELGESSYGWTRLPRLTLRAIQKFFSTRQMLPLVSCGIALSIIVLGWRPLAILIAVPLYYLLAQAPLHTEYRYVIGIHYFLVVLAAFTLYWVCVKFWQVTSELFRRTRKTRMPRPEPFS
jgi:hypothetical protein